MQKVANSFLTQSENKNSPDSNLRSEVSECTLSSNKKPKKSRAAQAKKRRFLNGT